MTASGGKHYLGKEVFTGQAGTGIYLNDGTKIIDGENGDMVVTDLTSTGTVIENATTSLSGAGAVAITGRIHEITTTGTDALTLADGTEGQRLSVVMVADGGDGTLTPTNLAGGTTITFAAVGDTAELLFTNGAWYMMGGSATIS